MGRTTVSAARSYRRRSLGRSAVIIAAVLVVVLVVSGPAWGTPATVVHNGPNSSKQIALTFDDNTQSARGVAVLRALQSNKVPATLFVIGSAVASTPALNAEIVKGMSAGLFEVGDHSRSHAVLTGLSASALAAEIGGGTDAFHEATGARTVPLFRPPYGTTNSRVAEVAGSEGFGHLVLWDVDPRDWSGGSASSIASRVISRAHSGAIVVMHMSAAHTAAAIPTIVSTLRAKGYEFVKVSTMLRGQRLFLDVDEDSEQGVAIADMVQQGYMSGYDGNYFGPGDTITRAQVAKVATLVGGLHTAEVERVEAPLFTDVRPKVDGNGAYVAYPFDFVEEAAAAGLVLGSTAPDGSSVFRPNDTITRLQLASILARMVRQLKGYEPGEPGPAPEPLNGAGTQPLTFLDVPDYAAADVAFGVGLGLMTGNPAGEFGAWSGARRGQVALAMSRYLDLTPYQPAD
jgi:peptidoglycan/xylan/chitin deacetylase (PgdA/CDA1 family)